MIIYKQCPVCKSESINDKFSAQDHTVSQESFRIFHCNNCSLRFTQHVPSQQEIGKYYASENYISHSDTQQGIVNRLYHIIRKKTLVSKQALIEKETGKAKGKILDVGCGTGAFLHTMKQAGWECTGLEPDETARNKASELYNIQPMPSEEIYALHEKSFDAITMWHVLEHVHDLHEYVAQLCNLLTPSGKLFIAVPNYTSYDAQHYGADWAAYDVPRHLYHFSPESMNELMKQHGLIIKKTKPMWFDSFYVSMLSEKYISGKGNIFRAFFSGLISNLKTIRQINKCSSLIYIISKN